MKSSQKPRRGLAVAIAIALLLAGSALVSAYFEGGLDGVCWVGSDFRADYADRAASWRSVASGWPPGRACVALAADGTELARETYPQPGDWVIATALFALPFVIRTGWRTVRHRGASSTD